MAIDNAEGLLRALLAGTTSSDVRKVLEEIGDFSGAELDQPFGKFQLTCSPKVGPAEMRGLV